jgi:hypothetical protein
MKTPEQEKRDIIAELRENQMWHLIHHHAKKDPVLQEQLDKVVIYYRLKYEQRRR